MAIAALAVGPWSFFSGVAGRWFVRPPNEKLILVAAITILVVTLVDWGIRLAA